jgi:hypothetical protein
VLFVAVSAFSEENDPSVLLPEEPSLQPHADDNETFETTVREARTALWYYDMYGIARSMAIDFYDLSIEQDQLVEAGKGKITHLEQENERLANQRATLFGIGVVVGVGVTALLVGFVGR